MTEEGSLESVMIQPTSDSESEEIFSPQKTEIQNRSQGRSTIRSKDRGKFLSNQKEASIKTERKRDWKRNIVYFFLFLVI